MTAAFSDGTTYDGLLLIRDDGVRSGVRKQFLPEHKMVDTNGRCIYRKTPLTEGGIDPEVPFPSNKVDESDY